MNDSKLTLDDRAILDLLDEAGLSHVDAETVAANTGLTVRAAKASLDRLEHAGELQRELVSVYGRGEGRC